MNIHSVMDRVPDSAAETGKTRTRQAIVTAATELFAERGYHGTAMPEIAAHAEVGVGTIYRHFADKPALGNEVYRHCKRAMGAASWSQMGRGGAVAVAGADPYRAEFLLVWRLLFGYALAHRSEFQFLEMHHHPDYLDAQSRALRDESAAPIQRFFERGIKAGAIAPLPVAALVGLSWGALVGVVRQVLDGLLQEDEALVERAGQAAWSAIAASPISNAMREPRK